MIFMILLPVSFIMIATVIIVYLKDKIFLKKRGHPRIILEKVTSGDALDSSMDSYDYDSDEPTRIVPPPIHPRETWEKVAEGRFCEVFKAALVDENESSDTSPCLRNHEESLPQTKYVAVKYSKAHEEIWRQECLVYLLPQMKHKNILNFLGAQKQDDYPRYRYWLVTEYHEMGSLFDFLKKNTVTFDQMLHISHGIACGLAHLHEDLKATSAEARKPPVAHRDFKSKNVLLKKDLTPCIADFGLSIILHLSKERVKLEQSGTARYMAPEVVEGAVSFKKEDLTSIDMYACGLVFWEISNRCKAYEDWPELKYCLPFEDVIPHATVHEMGEKISRGTRQERPKFPRYFTDGSHEGMKYFVETVEQVWEQEPSGRLTAACVAQRIKRLQVKNERGDKTAVPLDSSEGSSQSSVSSSFDGAEILGSVTPCLESSGNAMNGYHNHQHHRQQQLQTPFSEHLVSTELSNISPQTQHFNSLSVHNIMNSHNIKTSFCQETPPTQSLLPPSVALSPSTVVLPSSNSSGIASKQLANNTNSINTTNNSYSRYESNFKDSSIGSTTPLLMRETSEP
jgi:hypothetical protein